MTGLPSILPSNGRFPMGGGSPKGRLAEDGPLHKKYKLTEMPTDSYQDRAEQNVIGADGTVIISHGWLTGRSAYTEMISAVQNSFGTDVGSLS